MYDRLLQLSELDIALIAIVGLLFVFNITLIRANRNQAEARDKTYQQIAETQNRIDADLAFIKNKMETISKLLRLKEENHEDFKIVRDNGIRILPNND